MAAEHPTRAPRSKENTYWREKATATRLGISLDEYLKRIALDQKWCSECKAWHPRSAFGVDNSRHDHLASGCLLSKQARNRRRYIPVPAEARKQMGPPAFSPRDGDKRQARQRINVQVRTGKRPRPNSLPCVDCGHVWAEGERRHEYDHYLGYGAAHHYDVEPVCSTCHAAREWNRGVFSQKRRNTAQRKEGSDGTRYPH